MKTRDDAISLMNKWVQSESLRKHMLCVETAMRAYAKKFGEDEELWSICGLLHDFDYEKFPTFDAVNKTGHPYEGVKTLREEGYSEEIIDAILGHASYSNTPRTSNMAKCLFACDELCGFLVACGYMRPDKWESLTSESVVKRLKDKRFAAKVNRNDIDLGISEIGIEKNKHIEFVINALKPIQQQIFGQ